MFFQPAREFVRDCQELVSAEISGNSFFFSWSCSFNQFCRLKSLEPGGVSQRD
jgi:hypothetical protein